MSYTLTFNDERHEYTLNGRVVPGVTSIIKATMPQWQVGPWYLERGTAVHKACELYDLGTLDWRNIDKEIEPRLEAWIKFRKQFPARMLEIETMYGDPGWMYAGKIDNIMGVDDQIVVVDRKNSISPHVFVQLAGYSRLLRVSGTYKKEFDTGRVKAMAVELRANGQYQCQPMSIHELRKAETTFSAALTMHNFFKDNGMVCFNERSSHVGALTEAVGEGHHPHAEW